MEIKKNIKFRKRLEEAIVYFWTLDAMYGNEKTKYAEYALRIERILLNLENHDNTE